MPVRFSDGRSTAMLCLGIDTAQRLLDGAGGRIRPARPALPGDDGEYAERWPRRADGGRPVSPSISGVAVTSRPGATSPDSASASPSRAAWRRRWGSAASGSTTLESSPRRPRQYPDRPVLVNQRRPPGQTYPGLSRPMARRWAASAADARRGRPKCPLGGAWSVAFRRRRHRPALLAPPHSYWSTNRRRDRRAPRPRFAPATIPGRPPSICAL